MDKLVKQIAKESGEAFASKTEFAELRAIQTEWETAHRGVLRHTDIEAKAAWLEHQKELQEAVARDGLDTLDAYTREEFESEARLKLEICKQGMRAATSKGAALIEKIAERFAKVAEKFGSEAATAEAEAYRRFGVAYPGPSSLVAALRQAAAYARARVPRGLPYNNMSPKDATPYLDW